MATLRESPVFNRGDRFIEGWYWALRSRELKRGRVRALNLLGRELALYRTREGAVVAVDAYCPHMGCHLAEGRVDGEGLRCFFHDWRFAADGRCVAAPSLERPPAVALKTWPVAEKYGLIWVWTGASPRRPVPFVPELEGLEVEATLGSRFSKNCHPNVVMINAIDAHHFNSVHSLPVTLDFAMAARNRNVVAFSNTTRIPTDRLLTRLLGRFYAGPLTYAMCYSFASTGSVTVGPDAMHFHIIFALRMTAAGGTEGQTILVTRHRRGLLGWMFNRVTLFLTKVVGNYFAKGDTQVFQTIKFNLQTPTKADRSIVEFMRHTDGQGALALGTWEPLVAERLEAEALVGAGVEAAEPGAAGGDRGGAA